MSSPLQQLLDEFEAMGLTLTIKSTPAAMTQSATALLRRALQAGLEVGVADVQVEAQAADAGRTRLYLRLRAIDRSVAIAYARALDLAGLRVELEQSGGKLLQAHSRFAILHIDLEV